MAAAQTIRVNLAERSYDVEIGAGNLVDAGRFLVDRAKTTHVVLITDENVHKLHAMRAAESLGEQDIEVDVIVVDPGEQSKSPEAALSLWQGLLDLGADRRSVVAAVGGGVVGDLAGFVAATFARGLRFMQVPTSLLAQVDSSVGGKVGINLPEAKNIVGGFHQPIGVLVDIATLSTLPDREYLAGLAEAVKYGAALDAEFFGFLEQNAAVIVERKEEVLVSVVARCCRLKAEVVERDEREENGLRAVLNFGHTFGHAFEMISPLPLGEGPGVRAASIRAPLLHGEAVAVGMICAARLAERLGRVDASYTDRLRALLQTFGLPVEPPKLDPQRVLDAMMHDKKVQDGRLRFVLPSRLGHVELVEDVAPVEVQAAMEGNTRI
ncbi:MAG: 3-dehydroquinate synthase [Planctomycetes bacterium]|nr:3-dehydroquinate synthase [Planctomycetota bacterium]MCG2682128.1 3-dehydroquinate synthase [Planctomycetales bacterium]